MNSNLTFPKPDGTPYSGTVTLRSGVYKNGVYCPGAEVRAGTDTSPKSGRLDYQTTVTNGKLSLRFDAMQFKTSDTDDNLQAGDFAAYMIEYRFEDTYQSGYILLGSSGDLSGSARVTDSVIQLYKVVGGSDTPQIARQTLQQYYGDTPLSYTRDVLNYRGNIGISRRVSARFTRGEMTIRSVSLPFGVSNLSHQPDLAAYGGAAEGVAQEVKAEVTSKTDLGEVFKDINVNDMLRKGFIFLQKMEGKGGENMMHMMILPTEDPASFRIMVFVGYNKREKKGDPNKKLSIQYDPNAIYDDAKKFQKTLKELAKDDNKKKDNNSGDTQFNVNFYGTILLEARLSPRVFERVNKL